MALQRITLEQLDHLSVDDHGRLYWKGEKVQTGLRLSALQSVGAALTVLSAVLVGAESAYHLFAGTCG